MSNIFCISKAGNLGSRKSGMIIEVVDFEEPGWYVSNPNAKPEIPYDENVRYYVTKHDRSEKETLREGIKELGWSTVSVTKNALVGNYSFQEIDTRHKDYRRASLMIDEEKLKQITGNTKIIDDVLAKGKHVPTIDCTGGKNPFKNVADVESFPSRLDSNLINGGSVTVGAGGGFDYLTFVTLEADLGTLTSDLIGTLSTDISQDRAQFNTSLGPTYDLTLTSDNPPNGDVTNGWVVTCTSTIYCLQMGNIGSSTGNQEVTVENINFIQSGDVSNDAFGMVRFQMNALVGPQKIQNCFIDGANKRGVGIYCTVGSVNISNVGVRDYNNVGVEIAGALVASQWEQLLVEGCGVGLDIDGRSTITVVNSIIGGNTTDITNHASATGDFVLTVDGTGANGNWGAGTNCTTGITLANEVELDDSSANYAHVLETAPTADTSTTSPTINANLMDGVAWTDEISCCSQLGSAGVFTPYYYQKFLAGM